MKYVHCFLVYSTLFFSLILPKETTIFEDVRNRDKEAIQKRLDNDEDCSQKEDETGNNALHIAAENDDEEMIELLTTQPDRSGVGNWFYYSWYNYPKLPDKDAENKEGETPTYRAIKCKHGTIAKKLLEKGINFNKKNKKGQTLLHGFVQHVPEMIFQLSEYKIEMNAQDNEGKTAVHYAVQNQDLASIAYLAERGADLNIKDNQGQQPLIYSIIRGHLPLTQCLVEHGADVNIKDNQGKRPLDYSVIQGHLPLTQCLVGHGADVNIKNDQGDTPLHVAINEDKIEIAELLIQKGINASICNGKSFSPLFWILEKNKPQFIPLFVRYKLHLEKKENSTILHEAVNKDNHAFISQFATISDLVTEEDGNNDTVAMLAAKKSDSTILKILRSKGVDLTKPGSNGWQPIHSAVSVGNCETTKYLLDNGVSVDSLTGANNTPLLLSVIEGKEDVMELLLSRKADVRKCNKYGKNIVLLVAEHKRHNLIQRLKKYSGIDINMRDERGMTAFMHAAVNKDHVMMKELMMTYAVDISVIDNNADNVIHKLARSNDVQGLHMILAELRNKALLLSQQNVYGNTPLLSAIANNCREVAIALLEEGASCFIKNKKEETALFLAVEQGNSELVQLLIDRYKAPVNIVTKDGRMPLFVAVEKGYRNTTKALLRGGACLLSVNKEGLTIIHVAAKQSNTVILQDLLMQTEKPHIDVLDNNSRTPLLIAANVNNVPAMQLLEQWGANSNYTNFEGNNIAHYAASGKAVDALDYVIKKYPYLVNFQNKNKETPLMIGAKVNSLECVEKLLCENDFISRNIDKSVSLARLHGHTTIAQTLEQKINNRMAERLKIAQKGQEILNTKKTILELDEEILQKDFSHRRDYMLEQSLPPRLYSAQELYNKTNEECEKISCEYVKILDVAVHKKHQLINKRNEILRREEAAAIQKEHERKEQERRIREEKDRQQRIFEENKRKEEERLRQIAVKAQADELERLRKQKEIEDSIAAQKADFERIGREKALKQAQDEEKIRQQQEDTRKKAAAAIAAQKEAERLAAVKKVEAEKHAAALDNQQPYAPMDLKPSAPPIEEVQVSKCTLCNGSSSEKPLPCRKCRKKSPELCNTCMKKQNGQCVKCWNEVGKFTQKEQGECHICFEETLVTPPPCRGCKKGTSRYCAACLKTQTKCPTCMAQDSIEKNLMDEILK